MRALTLNVLFGGEDRFAALCALVAGARPDLVILQECVGWDEDDRLHAVAAAIGVPADPQHAVLAAANPRPSGIRYHVGLLSRAPIVRHAVHTEGVAHCVVEAELALGDEPLTVLGTHLCARDEPSRLAEVDALLRLVPPDALQRGAYLLAGDLNALARHDPYPPDLAARVARAGMDKYGHPPSFAVIDRLLAAGWVDALHAAPRSDRWVTARRERQGEVVDTRTDYVLLSPRVAQRLEVAEVVDVGTASDHHAVLAVCRPR
jgi:exodeoxyribonuclease-3